MHTLVLNLSKPNSSYRLSKLAAKTAHFGKTRKAIAFGFVNFEGFQPVTKLESKHITGKTLSRATECIL